MSPADRGLALQVRDCVHDPLLRALDEPLGFLEPSGSCHLPGAPAELDYAVMRRLVGGPGTGYRGLPEGHFAAGYRLACGTLRDPAAAEDMGWTTRSPLELVSRRDAGR